MLIYLFVTSVVVFFWEKGAHIIKNTVNCEGFSKSEEVAVLCAWMFIMNMSCFWRRHLFLNPRPNHHNWSKLKEGERIKQQVVFLYVVEDTCVLFHCSLEQRDKLTRLPKTSLQTPSVVSCDPPSGPSLPTSCHPGHLIWTFGFLTPWVQFSVVFARVV